MWKHITLQSFIQIILLIIFYLIAPEFIKEDNLVRVAENRIIEFCYSKYPGKDTDHIIYGTEVKWTTSGKLRNQVKQYCGSYATRPTLADAYLEYHNSNSATTHMCFIFNIFVFYTLFNQINCRVIDDSFNIFVRISKSLLFPLICFLEMGLQVAIIFLGKSPFHIVNDGFTGKQWGICIGFSAITFIVSIVAKLIPIHVLIDRYLEKKMIEEEEEEEKLEELNDQSMFNLKYEKVEIGKRKMTRHMSSRSNKKVNSSENRRLSINYGGVSIYSVKRKDDK